MSFKTKIMMRIYVRVTRILTITFILPLRGKNMKNISLLKVLMAALLMASPIVGASFLRAESSEEVAPITFEGPTVRVLLEHKSKGALLEVAGRYVLVDPKTSKRLEAGIMGQRAAVRPSKEGLNWGRQFYGIYQFKLAPRGGERVFWIDGVQYKGVLYVYQIGDTISLVNELSLEDYVAAAVEANSDEAMAKEAANALAICARSDAWYHVKTRPDAYWHIFGPEVNFHGIGGMTAESRGTLAARATLGLYITDAKFAETNGLFLARWTRHSAGSTVGYNQLGPERRENGEYAVQSAVALLDRDHTMWQCIITASQIEKAFGLPDRSLVDVTVQKDPKTQKVCGIQLKMGSDTKSLSYFQFVQALGMEKIQSSDFSISQSTKDQYSITGYGKGDGVGLCLYSAEELAQQGKRAPEILEVFFPGSKLEMLKE